MARPSNSDDIVDGEWYTVKVKGTTKRRLLLIKAGVIVSSGGLEEPNMDRVINAALDMLPPGVLIFQHEIPKKK